ncbi:PspC family transcriptional regulator [Lentzea flava]|nr:PspC family transcriptional regulator [Lentzea flava]
MQQMDYRAHCGYMTTTVALSRPRTNRMIAGVCAGLAQRWGMKAGTVRLLFLLSCLLPGPQFVVYLVLWVIMPDRGY